MFKINDKMWKFGIFMIYYFPRLFSFCPMVYNTKLKIVKQSEVRYCLTIITLIIFIISYPMSMKQIFRKYYLPKMEDVSSCILAVKFINFYFVAILLYSAEIITNHKLVILINKVFRLYERIKEIQPCYVSYYNKLCVYVIKHSVIHLYFTTITYIRFGAVLRNGTYWESYLTIIIFIPSLTIIYTVNRLYFFLTVKTHLFVMLNNTISVYVKLNKNTKPQTTYAKMNKYCELSDFIDRILIMHCELLQLTTHIWATLTIPAIAIVINAFCNFVIEFYFIYVNTTEALKMDIFNFHYVLPGIANVSIFLIELIYCIAACNSIVVQVNRIFIN